MIVLIDNYDSFTYNLYQLIAKIDTNIAVIRNDAATVDEIISMQPKAVVISPGPGAPQDSGICVELIKKMAPSVPILGICLGLQAIGIAFGGNVIRCQEIMHGKTSSVFHRRSGIFKGMPLPFDAGRYHSLIIEKESMPKNLEILADTHDGTIMAVKHSEYPCYGLQFHPESILTTKGDILVRRFFEIEVKPCLNR